jgi:type III secretion protein R
MAIVLGALALAPFLVIMLTSFVKISVVLSILRNALGTQAVPPNQVITGLAFILTIFVMTPVVRTMYAAAGPINNAPAIFTESNVRSLFDAADRGKEPLRTFLSRHAHEADRLLFMELAVRLDAASPPLDGSPPTARPDKNDFQVLIPAFVTSQLKEGFQIGFLVFVPFIVIDMVVANVLLAMGMSMLSPSVVSLPFKLLLFVLADGWFLLVRGLVLSYT